MASFIPERENMDATKSCLPATFNTNQHGELEMHIFLKQFELIKLLSDTTTRRLDHLAKKMHRELKKDICNKQTKRFNWNSTAMDHRLGHCF